jgi:hypothetical protein
MVPKSLAKWTRGSAKPKQKGNLDRRPRYNERASGKPMPRTPVRHGWWQAEVRGLTLNSEIQGERSNLLLGLHAFDVRDQICDSLLNLPFTSLADAGE